MKTKLTVAFCIVAMGMTLGIAPGNAHAEQPTGKPTARASTNLQVSVKQVLSEWEDARQASFDAFERSEQANEATDRTPILPALFRADKVRRLNLEADSAHKEAAHAHTVATQKYDILINKLSSLVPQLDAHDANRLRKVLDNVTEARDMHGSAKWSHRSATRGFGVQDMTKNFDRRYVRSRATNALRQAGTAIVYSQPHPERIDPEYLPRPHPTRPAASAAGLSARPQARPTALTMGWR